MADLHDVAARRRDGFQKRREAAGPVGAGGEQVDIAAQLHHPALDQVGEELDVDVSAAENAAFLLQNLPDTYSNDDLEDAMALLAADGATRGSVGATLSHMDRHGRSVYTAGFPRTSSVSSRVLWPHAPCESTGMEDARFVRFVDDSGDVRYYATYTAWDGVTVTQQMLETRDFVDFAVSPIAGAAAVGKGLALFPRTIGGRFAAMSRSDRETNAVCFSDDVRCWSDRQIVQVPTRPWELLQLGNCGSPIETDAGWLVLTHGVGPLRTYHIGAILLDLDDPTILLAQAHEPLISPDPLLQGGYVPNVVYTCGALAHGDVLVVPYGVGDQSIAVSTLSIADVLASMRRV